MKIPESNSIEKGRTPSSGNGEGKGATKTGHTKAELQLASGILRKPHKNQPQTPFDKEKDVLLASNPKALERFEQTAPKDIKDWIHQNYHLAHHDELLTNPTGHGLPQTTQSIRQEQERAAAQRLNAVGTVIGGGESHTSDLSHRAQRARPHSKWDPRSWFDKPLGRSFAGVVGVLGVGALAATAGGTYLQSYFGSRAADANARNANEAQRTANAQEALAIHGGAMDPNTKAPLLPNGQPVNSSAPANHKRDLQSQDRQPQTTRGHQRLMKRWSERDERPVAYRSRRQRRALPTKSRRGHSQTRARLSRRSSNDPGKAKLPFDAEQMITVHNQLQIDPYSNREQEGRSQQGRTSSTGSSQRSGQDRSSSAFHLSHLNIPNEADNPDASLLSSSVTRSDEASEEQQRGARSQTSELMPTPKPRKKKKQREEQRVEYQRLNQDDSEIQPVNQDKAAPPKTLGGPSSLPNPFSRFGQSKSLPKEIEMKAMKPPSPVRHEDIEQRREALDAGAQRLQNMPSRGIVKRLRKGPRRLSRLLRVRRQRAHAGNVDDTYSPRYGGGRSQRSTNYLETKLGFYITAGSSIAAAAGAVTVGVSTAVQAHQTQLARQATERTATATEYQTYHGQAAPVNGTTPGANVQPVPSPGKLRRRSVHGQSLRVQKRDLGDELDAVKPTVLGKREARNQANATYKTRGKSVLPRDKPAMQRLRKRAEIVEKERVAKKASVAQVKRNRKRGSARLVRRSSDDQDSKASSSSNEGKAVSLKSHDDIYATPLHIPEGYNKVMHNEAYNMVPSPSTSFHGKPEPQRQEDLRRSREWPRRERSRKLDANRNPEAHSSTSIPPGPRAGIGDEEASEPPVSQRQKLWSSTGSLFLPWLPGRGQENRDNRLDHDGAFSGRHTHADTTGPRSQLEMSERHTDIEMTDRHSMDTDRSRQMESSRKHKLSASTRPSTPVAGTTFHNGIAAKEEEEAGVQRKEPMQYHDVETEHLQPLLHGERPRSKSRHREEREAARRAKEEARQRAKEEKKKSPPERQTPAVGLPLSTSQQAYKQGSGYYSLGTESSPECGDGGAMPKSPYTPFEGPSHYAGFRQGRSEGRSEREHNIWTEGFMQGHRSGRVRTPPGERNVDQSVRSVGQEFHQPLAHNTHHYHQLESWFNTPEGKRSAGVWSAIGGMAAVGIIGATAAQAYEAHQARRAQEAQAIHQGALLPNGSFVLPNGQLLNSRGSTTLAQTANLNTTDALNGGKKLQRRALLPLKWERDVRNDLGEELAKRNKVAKRGLEMPLRQDFRPGRLAPRGALPRGSVKMERLSLQRTGR